MYSDALTHDRDCHDYYYCCGPQLTSFRIPDAQCTIYELSPPCDQQQQLVAAMIPPSATVPIMHPTSTEISFAALLLKVSTGSTDLEKREWSALIGIVTAIIGNILISFALNIQRYAHIKLGKEQDQRNSRWGSRRGSQPGSAGYGTEQAQIAAKRAELNLNAPAYDEDDAGHRARYHEAGDHDGLEEYSPRSRSSSESSTKGQTQSTSYLKSPYWWAGILLMITGEAGNFLAYGFAPASIVSPLGVVALVSNCIIAPCLLKERFRQRDLWGVVVAVGGAVTVVLSAETSENKKSPRDVWVAITRWEFELYLGISSLLIVLFLWASGRYGHKSLLIDLGLAGLFGLLSVRRTPDRQCLYSFFRCIHRAVNKGYCFYALGHPVASPDFPNHLSPFVDIGRQRFTSNTLC